MLLSDKHYLDLVANALDEKVLPELTAKGLQSTVTISVLALRELLHRQQVLPGLVAELLPKGRELLQQGQALVADGKDAESGSSAEQSYYANDQIEFQQLIILLDDYAKKLLEARSDFSVETNEQVSVWLREVATWEASYYRRFFAEAMPDVSSAEAPVQALTADKLANHLQQRLPHLQNIKVTEFESIPGGFANEIFFFTLNCDNESPRQLVIRKKGATPFWEFWAYKLNLEFAVVEQVAKAGLAVPEPLWLFEDLPDVDGDFYVMDRSYGRMVGGLGFISEEIPEAILLNLAEFLAKLHAIPLESFSHCLTMFESNVTISDTASDAVRKNLDCLYQQWSKAARVPTPGEAYVIDWLQHNVPDNPNRPVLVHADCFVHNFLVDGDEISAVVDWESCHFGDPAADMAYIVDQVSGLMDWQKFLDHYQQCGGQPINQSTIDYHKCFLNFRNYFGTNSNVVRVPQGFKDIRMTQLGSIHFNTFMNNCIDAIQSYDKQKD